MKTKLLRKMRERIISVDYSEQEKLGSTGLSPVVVKFFDYDNDVVMYGFSKTLTGLFDSYCVKHLLELMFGNCWLTHRIIYRNIKNKQKRRKKSFKRKKRMFYKF